MMNRTRKALVAVAAISSLTLGSGVAVAQDNDNSTQSMSSGSSENQNSSGSSDQSGTDGNKSSSQELSTDKDGKELTLLGKLKVIGEVLALVGSVLGGAFAIYQTVMKFQKAMEK